MHLRYRHGAAVSPSAAEKYRIKESPNVERNAANIKLCHICSRKFHKKTKHDWHIKNHHKMIYKCCEIGCAQMFHDFSELRGHYWTKHGKGISKFETKYRVHENVFTTQFPTEYNALQNSSRNKLQCHICRRTFSNKVYRDRHVKYHVTITMYKCPLQACGYMYAGFKLYRQHCRDRHGIQVSETRQKNTGEANGTSCR